MSGAIPLLIGAISGGLAWYWRTNDAWKDWWSGWALAAALCFLGESTRSSASRGTSIRVAATMHRRSVSPLHSFGVKTGPFPRCAVLSMSTATR